MKRTDAWVMAVGLVLLLLGSAAAQETTADWKKRILDPKTIGITPFPGSTLNKKITVDTIRYDKANKRIAVYMVPLDKQKEVMGYFTKTLGVEPVKGPPDAKGYDRFLFSLTGDGKYPPQAKGLTVIIMRSPWVDGTAQIQMEYPPPAP